MRTLLVLVIFGLQGLSAQKLEIAPLTGDCYIFTTYHDYNGTPFPSNGMYVVTGAGVVLIDTPWDVAQCQPLLDTIAARHGKEVVFCLSTHFHDDRTAGLDFFRSKGIRTWSSKATKRLCRKEKAPEAEFTFAKDTTFSIGGKTFRTFYPGKGHTEDNILVWFETEKVLYGGCFIKSTENTSLGNVADADVKAWPKSVRKTIAAFPEARFFIPGHFGWEGDGLRHTLQLLEKP